MLIVCTQDRVIRETAAQPGGSGQAWAPVALLPEGPEGVATAAFARALRGLPRDAALCLSAHGNDREIGDSDGGWTWTTTQVASLLAEGVTADWQGPVLIHACADSVANFSAGLAVALRRIGAFPGRWCFGYNRTVPSNEGFPPPTRLGERVDLQGTQV